MHNYFSGISSSTLDSSKESAVAASDYSVDLEGKGHYANISDGRLKLRFIGIHRENGDKASVRIDVALCFAEFGPPVDDGMKKHRLYGKGIDGPGFYEVSGSTLKEQVMGSGGLGDWGHYVLVTEKGTLEFVSDLIEPQYVSLAESEPAENTP